ncbi:DNA methyltransferase [Enterococcus florum]|uniref:DNA methyltransferase n=1 Tax=Enterococcus florum TaxID=2480627 RepID=A0A4P5PF23_9ENTE|nr:MGMT family protein [Enterococcus florum]GCF95324.1 DNA methyltransferase [Enterococcus florum]
MARLTNDFVFLILSIVEEIPEGKVATYGQIAELAGFERNARLVGKVLSRADFYGKYPCHRVVNSKGECAKHWPAQKNLLKAEAVRFTSIGSVDLKNHRWEPE